MKINKLNLQKALFIVKPGLAHSEVLEQTTSFAFLKGRVVTYNDEISISHPLKGIDFTGAIKAEELYGLLTRLDQEEVQIEKTKNEIKISSGRVKAGLKLEEKVNLPLRKIPKEWIKFKDPTQFVYFLGLAMQTCSTDMSKPKLTCVYVREDGAVIGSDGFRIVYCQGHGTSVKDFLIPASNVREVISILPTHIYLEEGWAHFKNKEGTVISCRRVNDEYVPIDQLEGALKVSKKCEEIEFPKKIEAMLDRGKQFARQNNFSDEIVNIKIDNGKLYMSARADETGSWIEEKASIKSKTEVAFGVTPSLFEKILTMSHTCLLDQKGKKIKFIMNDVFGGDCEYLIMLAYPKK